ncbi:MAG TPA: glycosyltransferase family 4 protein [Candidatus Angelobacter sp.]|nr:glycosyltransferase family 4 protein [Candidatus Angelobacter sp.]
MKILMLHNHYLVSGGEDQATSAEVDLLRKHGHEVELLEQDNHRVEQLGKVQTALRTVWSSESYRWINNKLKKDKFDVMHVQNFFPLWSPSIYYAAARNKVPVVQTLHNYRLMCVNSLFYRDGHACEDCLGALLPWRGVLHRCYRDSRAASAVVAAMVGTHKLIRTWTKHVHAYVTVSEFAREKFIADGGLPEGRIFVRPNFIDPAPLVGSGGGGYAIYVGRLSMEKGIETMLQAWSTGQNVLPLKIVGDGPLREKVIAASTATPVIEYLGSRTFSEVLELMRHAEFLVFPSEVYETMGRTIMEAFAVGTPAVVSAMGAHGSAVTEGENGFLFSPGDIADLRNRIEWCSANLQHLRSMRANARAEYEAKYSGAMNARKLLEIYRIAQEQTRY